MDGFRVVTLDDGTQALVDSGRQVAFRKDGTATAWSDWSETPRRAVIRFNPARDGGLIPKDRGKRREAVIDELGYLLDAHGVSLSARERPGPQSKLPADDVVAAVDRLRSEGHSFTAAYAKIAEEQHFAPTYVKRQYLAGRKGRHLKPSQAESEPRTDGPLGPDLLEWIRQVQSASGVSFSTACGEVAAVMAWTPEQLSDRLLGHWKWQPGGWTRIDENEKEPGNRD